MLLTQLPSVRHLLLLGVEKYRVDATSIRWPRGDRPEEWIRAGAPAFSRFGYSHRGASLTPCTEPSRFSLPPLAADFTWLRVLIQKLGALTLF